MRKKFIRILAALLLIFSLVSTTAYAESAAVTGNAVNLRAGPGTGYRVLDTLVGGTVVEVGERTGNWYAVRYNGVSGYMSAGYLSLLSSSYQSAAVEVSAVAASSYDPYEAGSAVLILDGDLGRSSAASQSGGSGSATVTIPAAAESASANVTIPAASSSSASSSAPASSSSSASVSVSVSAAVPASSDGSAVIILADGSSPDFPASAAPAASSAAASNVGKSGFINMDFVCLRSGPSGSHSIISTYNKGKELVITGEASGSWTPCRIDNRDGYVYTQYITLREQQTASAASAGSASAGNSGSTAASTGSASPAGSTTVTAAASGSAGYISGNNVRLRSGPSMSASILGELFYGNSVSITGRSGDWTAVVVSGQAGYVYSQYVKSGSTQQSGNSTSAGSTTNAAAVSVPSTGSATGQQIAQYALQFVGYNYKWGGMSPETGFDCSGLVKYVYSKFGYTLNRVAGDQALNGVHVDNNALQPGDVLCFYSSANYIGHTGIYIGNNKFVHASTSTTGVIISELSGYYTERGFVARRIV